MCFKKLCTWGDLSQLALNIAFHSDSFSRSLRIPSCFLSHRDVRRRLRQLTFQRKLAGDFWLDKAWQLRKEFEKAAHNESGAHDPASVYHLNAKSVRAIRNHLQTGVKTRSIVQSYVTLFFISIWENAPSFC